MMKIYAAQIAPEYQESPLFLEDEFFPDNITLTGNRHFNQHETELFSRVFQALEAGELAEALEDLETGGYYSSFYRNATEAINDLLPPEKGRYNTKQIHALRELVKEYAGCHHSDVNSIICNVLSIVSGVVYDWQYLRGDCQGDWVECFYPVEEWSREALKNLETEYFNTGTEWTIDEGDFNPGEDDPGSICGCSVYCHADTMEGIKQEIADNIGGIAADVILYLFKGWSRSPVYKEAV